MSTHSSSTLGMFLGSLDERTFVAEHWGRRYWSATSPDLLAMSLLGVDDFIRIVAFLCPRPTSIRLADSEHEEWKGPIEPGQTFARVTSAISRGLTAAMERLDLFWPPVIDLCGHLADELGCPVHANAYLTPPRAAGLPPHYDTHDVFVVQLEGEKRWALGQIAYELPTERTADGVVDEMRVHTELVLRPGDTLYVPRGMVHAAEAGASSSLHLTIGCIPATFGGELKKLADAAAHRLTGLRASIRPSTDPADAQRARLAALLAEVGALLTEVGAPAVAPQSDAPRPWSRVDDARARFRAALDVAGIGHESRFSVQDRERIVLVEVGAAGAGRHVLRAGSRSMPLDEDLVAAARAIIAMPEGFSLSDLPPELDTQHAVRALVRMVSASFVQVVA